ncbi:MAG: hypothetical protein HQL36_02885 [Alphaproteobacteria bacterium]|nr:hypothetical protein [Alphaproteobacteria bacterium]
MSKKRPDKVFRVCIEGDSPVYVLARHIKGAKSVAETHGHTVQKRLGQLCIYDADADMRDRCINLETA